MKTYELSINSWHYKLANYLTNRVGHETNICEYTRALIVGAIHFVLLNSFIVGILGLCTFSIINGLGALLFGWELLALSSGTLILLGSMVMFLSTMFGATFVKDKMSNWANNNSKKEQNRSFVYLMYIKFKEKTCFKIQLK